MTDSTKNDTRSSGIGDHQFPLGLSSRQFGILVIAGTIVLPGLLVYIFKAIGFSTFGDFVWIIGYGTGIFVVWYIWIRPLDLVGASEQDTSTGSEGETHTDQD
jgi:hypothetical protein